MKRPARIRYSARVEDLLKAHDRPDSFLDRAGTLFPTVDYIASPPLAEHVGTLIGPYKLLQQIGEGGMGVVFMAEQQTPVRRRVALKIIKTGHGHPAGHRPVRGRAAGAGA